MGTRPREGSKAFSTIILALHALVGRKALRSGCTSRSRLFRNRLEMALLPRNLSAQLTLDEAGRATVVGEGRRDSGRQGSLQSGFTLELRRPDGLARESVMHRIARTSA